MATTDIGIRIALDGTQQTQSDIHKVNQSLDSMAIGLKKVGHYGAGFLVLQSTIGGLPGGFIKAADSVTILDNQLKLATGSTQAAGKAYEALFDIAQRSRVSFTELGGTFASISRAGEALGISQTRLLGVTEAISNAVAISGGSAESARASLVQLSQGLASGTLRGDELNSVMEQTPRLAKALADGLGVSTGELRKLGEQGKITAASVITALESQAKVLSGEVKDSVVTVGQALTQMQNATVMAIGEFDKASGASGTLASALQGLTGSITTVGQAFKENERAIDVSISALTGVAVSAGLLAVAANIGKIRLAYIALAASATANPVGLALLAIGATVGTIAGYVDSVNATAVGLKSQIKELERLNAQAAASPHDAIINANVAKRSEKIIALRKELEKLDEVQRKADAPIGSVGSGDTALRRELARQQAANPVATVKKPAGLSDAEKGLRLYNDEMAKATGLNADFAEKWGLLGAAFKAHKISVDDLTAAQAALLKEQTFSKDAAKDWEEQSKASAHAIAESIKDYDRYVDGLQNSSDAVAKQVQTLEDEEKALALASALHLSLAQAIEEVTIARLGEQQALEYKNGNQEAGDAIKQEIANRQQLVNLIGSKEARTESDKAAKDSAAKAAKEWQRGWEETDRLARDVFTTWAEDGSNAAQKIGDTLKKALLSAIYEATIKPLAFQVYQSATSALGLGGKSGASGNLLSTASDAYGMYDKGMKAYDYLFGAAAASPYALTAAGAVTGLGGGAATVGGALIGGAPAAAGTYSLVGATGSTLASVSGVGATIGGGLTGASTVGALSGTLAPVAAAAPVAAGGLSGVLAGIGPVGWIAGGLLLLAGLFGGGGKYVKSTGDAALDFDATGNVASRANFQDHNYAANLTAASDNFAIGLNARYLDAAKALNIGTVASGFAFGSNDSDGGKFRIGAQVRDSKFDSGEIAQTTESVKLAADRAVFAALKGSDMPKYLAGVFDDISASTATSEAINAAITAAGAFKNLHEVASNLGLDALKDSSYTALKAITDFSGGMDKFGTNLTSYYANFYKDGEKQLATLSQMEKALRDAGALTKTLTLGNGWMGTLEIPVGTVDMPKTREQFRALADAQDLTTAAGQRAYAALVAVSGAFAEFTAATVASLKALAATKDKLEIDLLNAQGKTAQAKAAQRALDIAAFGDAEIAAYDYNQSLRDQIAALNDASTAAESATAATAALADALRDTLQAALDASRTGVADALSVIQKSVDAQKAALTTAYTEQADTVKASLDTVGTSIGKLQSLSSSLKSTIDGMRIAGSDTQYRVDAQAQIRAALATVRAGGALPLDGQLTNALATVSKPSEQMFATFADYARDFYGTANDIAALGDLTSAQLTGEEITQALLKNQVDALKSGFYAETRRLDDIYTAAVAQAEAVTKQGAATLTLAQALEKFTLDLGVTLSNTLATAFGTIDTNGSNTVSLTEFQAAFRGVASEATLKSLFTLQDLDGNGVITQLEAIAANTANLLATMRVTGTGGTAAGAGTYTGTQLAGAIAAEVKAGTSTAGIISAASSGLGVTSADLANVAAVSGNAGITAYQAAVNAAVAFSAADRAQVVVNANAIASAQGISPERALYNYAIANGLNAGVIDKMMGYGNDTMNGWATSNGLPAFAQGINYVPHDMTARIHEGEAVVPKSYNPYNPNAARSGDTERLEKLVEALTAEVQGLRAEAQATAGHTSKTARLLDRAMPDGDALATRVAA